MRLYLVRHGETDWNARRLVQGREDVPLNDRGRAQARATAQALRLFRAAQVAAARCPGPVRQLRFLRKRWALRKFGQRMG